MKQGQRWRLEMRLKDRRVLAEFMAYKHLTVRELAARTGISRSLIGHLRSGHRNTCKAEAARLIEEKLGAPPGLLFEPRASRVSQAARGQAA